MRWLEARHRDRNSPCLIEAHTAAGAFQRERAKQQQPQPWHNNLSSSALQARDMVAYQAAKVAAEDTTQRKDAAQRPAAEAALPISLLPSPHQNNLITSLPNLVTHTNTFTLHNQMGGGGTSPPGLLATPLPPRPSWWQPILPSSPPTKHLFSRHPNRWFKHCSLRKAINIPTQHPRYSGLRARGGSAPGLPRLCKNRGSHRCS